MADHDTASLLRECNAGIKMGVSAINEILPKVQSNEMRQVLLSGREEHEKLWSEARSLLNEHGGFDKDPGAVAKAASWIKTESMMAMKPSDHTAADLITDGCQMGIKSLNRYLNEYAASDEKSRNLTRKVIKVEEKLASDFRKYL